MAYYLGRNVKVDISTEQAGSAVTVANAGSGPSIDLVGVGDTVTITNAGSYDVAGTPTISVSGGGGSGLALTAVTGSSNEVTSATVTDAGSGYTSAPTLTFTTGTSVHGDTASGTITISRDRDANTLFADGLNWGGSGTARVTDLTGIDLSIGAVDEDITYMGFRNITKAEIKKETTISLTRKKSDGVWDRVYNENWKCGVSGTSSNWVNLEEPNVGKGYRIYVTMVSGTEVFVLPNACISSHTTSFNADGATEETLEFYSYVSPIIAPYVSSSATTAATTRTNL